MASGSVGWTCCRTYPSSRAAASAARSNRSYRCRVPMVVVKVASGVRASSSGPDVGGRAAFSFAPTCGEWGGLRSGRVRLGRRLPHTKFDVSAQHLPAPIELPAEHGLAVAPRNGPNQRCPIATSRLIDLAAGRNELGQNSIYSLQLRIVSLLGSGNRHQRRVLYRQSVWTVGRVEHRPGRERCVTSVGPYRSPALLSPFPAGLPARSRDDGTEGWFRLDGQRFCAKSLVNPGLGKVLQMPRTAPRRLPGTEGCVAVGTEQPPHSPVATARVVIDVKLTMPGPPFG